MASRKPAKPKAKAKAPTGKPKPTRSPHSAMDVLADARQQRALQLRIRGLSFRQIAEELEVDVATAHRYLKAALAELAEQTKATTEEYRAQQAARLEALIAASWPLATGDTGPILRAVREACEARGMTDEQTAKALARVPMPGLPSHFHVQRVAELMKQLGALFGTDAPVKLAATNLDGTEERATYVFPLPPTLDLATWQAAAAKAAQRTE